MKAHHCDQFRRRTLTVAVFSALAALAALPAAADPLLAIKLFRDSDIMFREGDMSRYVDNYVEFGAGYNSNDSFKFGQFSGLIDQGAFGIANFNWQQRGEQNDARYWRVYGANLGLTSRKVLGEAGLQGLWNASVAVDQLKRSEVSDGRFIHQGLGSNTLSLKPGCSAFTNANALARPGITRPLNMACLEGFEVQQGRDIYRLGLNGNLSTEWDFKVNLREDRRNGTRITGIYFNNALNVPYAIDDNTLQMDAALSYATKKAQWQLGYQYSGFDNNATTFDVANPFSTGASLGRMSLMPDNGFHSVNTTGAYNFSRTTRLSGGLSYGVATQNQAFLPYSANLAAGAVNNVTPRASLDGKVINTEADLALNMKPIDKANVKLAYQYRDSDNRTPIAEYIYLSRDATAPIASANSANYRRNVPVSTTERRYTVDGDYEIAARTYLRAILERQSKSYQLSDRSETDTDKFALELRRPMSDVFDGSLGYTLTRRTGSDYDKNVYYRNSYNPRFQTNNGVNNRGLTNHPSMRSYMYGDYREHRLKTAGNWVATETVSLQASLDAFRQSAPSDDPSCSRLDALQNDAFLQAAALPATCFGRTLATGGSVNFDLQWQPDVNLTTFAFVNLSSGQTDIHGRQWTINTAQGTDPARDWYGKISNSDQTIGFGMKWQPVEPWDLGATYVYSRGGGSTDIQTSVNPGLVPDTASRLQSLQLFAKWDQSKAISWRFNYVYEKLNSSDWKYDNSIAGSNNTVLFTGQTSAKYVNHVIGVSVMVKRW